MTKPSSAKPAKISTPSAWAKGPPTAISSASSSRPQSPAPSNAPAPTANASHSRRPSALAGQAVNMSNGVSIPRQNVGSVGRNSHVSFGSIDNGADAPPISSSPASTPSIKDTVVKSFGTVPATPHQQQQQPNGKSVVPSSSTPTAATKEVSVPAATPVTKTKFDVKSLFQTAPPSSASQPSSDASSPAVRPSPLPTANSSSTSVVSAPSPATHPTPPVSGTFNSFPRNQQQHQQQQPQQPSVPGQRSPAFQRAQPPNGSNAGPRPPQSAGANVPPGPSPMSPGLPNNRPPTNQPPAPGMPPQMQWPQQQFYYPMGGSEAYMYPPWYMPPGQHPQQHPPLHMQQHMLPHTPMSPRNQPLPHASPTPAPASAASPINGGAPSTPHPPPNAALPPQGMPPPPGGPSAPPPGHHHHQHSNSQSISSPPPTPSSARLSMQAPAFVPGGGAQRKVTIKKPDGSLVQPPALGSGPSSNGTSKAPVQPGPATSPPPMSASPQRRSAIPIVKPEEKEKEERERKEREERERIEKEKKEKIKKEEEAKEKLKKEEEERIRVAEEEAAAKAKAEAEAAAEAEKKRKEEDEAKAAAAAKKAEEEAAQKKKAEDEAAAAKKKAEEEAAAAAEKKQAFPTKEDEAEDGEIKETKPEPAQKSPDIRKRPGPLDLSTTRRDIPQPLPSALATARIIENINTVSYPEGIKSPKVELNQNAKDGKFRYDRDFLLQFMNVCKEKPDSLPPLDVFGLEPSEQIAMSRGGSGRHRTASATVNRQSSLGMGFNPAAIKDRSASGFSGMGNFGVNAKLSSEERFLASTGRTMSGSGSSLSGFRPTPMARTASQGGQGSQRTRSKRGTQRSDANKMTSANTSHGGRGGGGGYNNAQDALNLEPVAPLQATENRWDRKTLQQVDPNSPEIVERKVKGLLNKLTMEKFDSISDQIVGWANKSEAEKDGRTLIQVIRLVFEKATDEATWSEMYARLCRKMMEMISPKVQDDGIRNSNGEPIAGGQLFRKYLLNRCQEDFERGWAAKEATNAAAKSKASEDDAIKAENEKNAKEGKETEEAALYSEEYYAAQKAKRQGLGLIKFIGELFKLQMLTERIMHECVKKLLGNVDNPEEEEIESLCKLLSTVGAILDTPKAKAHMDVYFSRMKELTRSPNVSSRMQFMLQDVLELRERRWVSRNAVAAPTTIAAVHELAAKEKAAETSGRTVSMSRGGSRRGGPREEQTPGPDGWVSRPTKAGDLSKFGQIGNRPSALGPGGVFGLKDKKSEKRESGSVSRASSNSNMFSMLSQGGDAPTPEPTSSRPPSRKPSVDLGSGGTPDAAGPPLARKKLALLPRSKPVESTPTETSVDSPARTESPSEEADMSEADAKKKIDEDLKEFFAVRSLDEAEDYFIKLPSKFHSLLVDKLISSALESKESDAQLVSDLFKRARDSNLASLDSMEAGFTSPAEFIDDVAIDAPKAPVLMGIMMKGPGFSEDQRSRIASKSGENSEKLLSTSAP